MSNKSYILNYVNIGTDAVVLLPDGTSFKLGDNSSKLINYVKEGDIVFIHEPETNVSLELKISNNIITEANIVFY